MKEKNIRCKKRPENFKITKKGGSHRAQFFMNYIEWKSAEKNIDQPLLVTVSRTSGPAVLRNRWKRIVREWFVNEFSRSERKISPGRCLWIRLNRSKNLSRPLSTKDWSPQLSAELERLKGS